MIRRFRAASLNHATLLCSHRLFPSCMGAAASLKLQRACPREEVTYTEPEAGGVNQGPANSQEKASNEAAEELEFGQEHTVLGKFPDRENWAAFKEDLERIGAMCWDVMYDKHL